MISGFVSRPLNLRPNLYHLIISRKLVLLKLEKGYEFGDVLLDGSMPNHHSNVADSQGNILSTSMFTPVKNNQQKVCIVANEGTIKKYRSYSAILVNVSNDGDENRLF